MMTRAMHAFEDKMAQGGMAAVDAATGFFMRDDPVNRSLRQVAGKLHDLQIPYAISDVMPLVAHGYDRTTVDVDILVTPEDLTAIHQQLDALDYVPPLTNTKTLSATLPASPI